VTCRDEETPAQALRDLARWIVRDRGDSDHLDAYMRALLRDRLIELPASCRLEAKVVVQRFSGLSPREVASHLCKTACSLEQKPPSRFPQWPERPHDACECSRLDDYSRPRRKDSAPKGRPKADRSSFVPEFIGAIAFVIPGVAMLLGWLRPSPSEVRIGDDECLHFAVAATYLLIGMLYACAGARQAWRNGCACTPLHWLSRYERSHPDTKGDRPGE